MFQNFQKCTDAFLLCKIAYTFYLQSEFEEEEWSPDSEDEVNENLVHVLALKVSSSKREA